MIVEENVDWVQKQRKKSWGIENAYMDHWRGRPTERITGRTKDIPLVVELENAMWSKIFNFDLKRYYEIPEEYLSAQLKMKIYKFKNIPR